MTLRKCVSIIGAILFIFHEKVRGTDVKHPNVSITWVGHLGNKSVPPMKINFIQDMKIHSVKLKSRSPFGKMSVINDICSFQGTIEGLKKSLVTVSGCPYEDFQVIIHIKHQKPLIATVSNGVTYLPKLIERSSKDVLIKDVNDTDHLSNGAGYGKRELPEKLYIRLAVAIDETFKDYFDNDIDKAAKIINQIMLHAEGLFHDESLGTDVTFQDMTLYDHSEVSSIGAASEDHLSVLGPYAEEYNKEEFFNHFVLFSYDASGDAVVGMSYIGKICSEDSSSRISIAEYDQSPVHTAMIFAHELGHNLGLAHDAGICVGIMYPLIIGADAWSDCSKLQLKGYYNNILNKIPFFCLEEGSGTWSHWSKWSHCNNDCKRTRKRKCDKNICTGDISEEQSCHPCGEVVKSDKNISPTKMSINIVRPSTTKTDNGAVSKVKNVQGSDADRLIDLLFGKDISPTMRRILRAKFKLGIRV